MYQYLCCTDLVSRGFLLSCGCGDMYGGAEWDIHERSLHGHVLCVFQHFELRLCVCVERVSGDQRYGCCWQCVSIFRWGHCDVLCNSVFDWCDISFDMPRRLHVSFARSGARTVSSRYVFGVGCIGMYGGAHGKIHGGSKHGYNLRLFE